MGRVIMGPWCQQSTGRSSLAEEDGRFYDHDYRTWEQCCIQQEHAFHMGQYYEVFVVNGNMKQCFVKPCTRDQALLQMNLRGAGL